MDIDNLRSEFIGKYGANPRIFRAPGRVNLIGEHTDYNEGFVLPAALDFATYVAAASRSDRLIRVASLKFEDIVEIDLDQLVEQSEKTWAKYVLGVGVILERAGYRLGGADLLIDSDVPVGSGLSSSAALEISAAFALASLSGHQIDGMELARIGQTAEHEFAGVRSGIMDQFAAVFGEVNNALFLDCRSLGWSPVPLAEAKFMICNTKTKHDLADGEYNKRRAECEAAAAFLGKTSLRDVSWAEFEASAALMPEIPKKRARHIISENERVLSSVHALSVGDLTTFGQLMNASHDSLRDDFEVSCRELDIMVDIARSRPDILGARMTGGGFGGCTINLISGDDSRGFIEFMSDAYSRESGIVPDIHECRIGQGVYEIGPDE